MKVLSVVGARPNFMKTLPVVSELRRREGFSSVVVHTGQHYDDAMSQIFLDELGTPAPEHFLDAGSGSHAAQTARIMERLEPVLLAEQPDVVLVPGDVNGTMAAALTAAKLGLAVGHIEAGLRSFDWSMPEEINRVVTDRVSDLLFTHSPEADENLRREGVSEARIHPVGNTMIDSLVRARPRFEALRPGTELGLEDGEYLLVTLHRPALVDGPLLADALAALDRIACEMPVVFPCHPRTRQRVAEIGGPASDHLHLLEPVGYLEFMALLENAAGVLTDSGGVQEETTFLGVPCLTLRDNTERPVTVELGTNVLLGLDPARIEEAPRLIDEIRGRERRIPDSWDGSAAVRLVDVLERSAVAMLGA